MGTSTIGSRNLGKSADLSEGVVNPYYVSDLKRRVSVTRVAGKLYAFDDLCTHEGCQLSAGKLVGTILMCPCHGSQFDITTGDVVRGPAKRPLTTYGAGDEAGEIEISL